MYNYELFLIQGNEDMACWSQTHQKGQLYHLSLKKHRSQLEELVNYWKRGGRISHKDVFTWKQLPIKIKKGVEIMSTGLRYIYIFLNLTDNS